MTAHEEMLEVFDDTGTCIGIFPRSECHRNNALAHRSVHVLVFDRDGGLVLQKRSASKDLYPLVWDTSVGGHLSPGEDYRAAATRECREELGFTPLSLRFLYSYTMRSTIETELVQTFHTVFSGPFIFDGSEVCDVRTFSLNELFSIQHPEQFSPFFLREMVELRKHLDDRGGSV